MNASVLPSGSTLSWIQIVVNAGRLQEDDYDFVCLIVASGYIFYMRIYIYQAFICNDIGLSLSLSLSRNSFNSTNGNVR